MTKNLERAQRFASLGSEWDQGNESRHSTEQRMHFGQYVRELRKTRRLSRLELAKHVRIDQELLFCLENGLLTNSEIDTLIPRIAPSLETKVEVLRECFENFTSTIFKGENDE